MDLTPTISSREILNNNSVNLNRTQMGPHDIGGTRVAPGSARHQYQPILNRMFPTNWATFEVVASWNGWSILLALN